MIQIENQTNYALTLHGRNTPSSTTSINFQSKHSAMIQVYQLYHITINACKTVLIVPPINCNKVKIWERTEATGDVKMVVYEFYNGATLIKQVPRIPSDDSRRVRFMASADPQFFKDAPDRNDVAEDVMKKMWKSVYENPDTYFGQIIAGDLTQLAIKTEWKMYKKLADVMEIYDGWGNHDVENDWIAWTIGDRDAWIDILEHITTKWRRFPCSYDADPLAAHYSWDWRDVHFVQTNLLPSDSNACVPDDDESGGIDPKKSLSFLRKDLRDKVGNSGRPVVIVSHLGMEPFSGGCWEEGQKERFWDVIANYNVILIISGHQHNHYGEVTWNRPTGKSNGPDSIINIIAGGACLGYHMDIEITDNHIEATRYHNGNQQWEKSWDFSTTTNFPVLEPKLKSEGHAVYIIMDGERRWIPNPDTLFGLGYNWGSVEAITNEEKARYPMGSPFPSLTNGNIYKGTSNHVYLMQNKKRCWITSSAVFNRMGLQWDDLQRISDKDLMLILEGEDII